MKKLVTIMALTLCAVIAFAGCAQTGTTPSQSSAAATATTAASASEAASATAAPSASEAAKASTAALTGKVQMSGSTSMEKVANALAEDFMAKNPGVTVDVQLGGSSVGISDVVAGKVDIGNASRELKEEETAQGATPNIIAIDGIAAIINPKNEVAGLTKEQLVGIYTGKITNWSDVGGADSPIVVIGREASSGTREAFETLLDIKDKCKMAQELNESGALKTAVASTENAIGYVSLDLVDETVKAVKVDDVDANVDNIKSGTYSLQRPFIMATKGEVRPEVQAFLDYVMGAEGQAVVEQVGLITVQ